MKKTVINRTKSKVLASSKTAKPLTLSVQEKKAKFKSSALDEVENFVPLTDADGEVRELTASDFALMKPMSEVLPHLVELYKKSRGRPRKEIKSVPKSIRLAPDVAKHFEAMGKGWQTRMNEVLREWILTHKI